MHTTPSRRRRLAALLAALLLGLVGVVGAVPTPAEAQADCPPQQPLCDLDPVPDSTTSTAPDTTATTDDDVTTTTTDDEDDQDDGSTATTRRTSTTQREIITTTTYSVTTRNDILVPGDGTEGAESTTTTARTISTGESGVSDDTLILLMVAGLGAMAVLVGILTWRYWHATRPPASAREVEVEVERRPGGRGSSVFLD